MREKFWVPGQEGVDEGGIMAGMVMEKKRSTLPIPTGREGWGDPSSPLPPLCHPSSSIPGEWSLTATPGVSRITTSVWSVTCGAGAGGLGREVNPVTAQSGRFEPKK